MALLTITEKNFQTEVLESNVPVLIDFWAPWCGPCRMLSPLVEQIAATADGFKVGKINIDEEMALAVRYGVSAIPTLMVFKNGELYKTSVGLVPKEMILDLLK